MTVYVNSNNKKVTEREISEYFNNIPYELLYNRTIIATFTFIKSIDLSSSKCAHALFLELNLRPKLFGDDIIPHMLLRQQYTELFEHEYIDQATFFKYLPSEIKLEILNSQLLKYNKMLISGKTDPLLIRNVDYFINNYFINNKHKELKELNQYCSSFYSISLLIERMIMLYDKRVVVKALRSIYCNHYRGNVASKMFKMAVPKELKKYVYYYLPVIKNK